MLRGYAIDDVESRKSCFNTTSQQCPHISRADPQVSPRRIFWRRRAKEADSHCNERLQCSLGNQSLADHLSRSFGNAVRGKRTRPATRVDLGSRRLIARGDMSQLQRLNRIIGASKHDSRNTVFDRIFTYIPSCVDVIAQDFLP